MQESIHQFRQRLDALDARLLDVIAERLDIARAVAKTKENAGARLRDRQREAELLAGVRRQAQARGLPAETVIRLFREILNLSFHEQIATVGGLEPGVEAVRVGYQGVAGAYSEWAAHNLMAARRKTAQPIGYHDFKSVAESVVEGRNPYGVLPVENTLTGSIHEPYDLLKRYPLSIVGEEALPIEHCLAAIRPIEEHEIKRVYSHPQALMQCAGFLKTLPHAEACPHFDTASAMQKIAEDQDPFAAAIAGEHAAERYGLTILRRRVADHGENYTRFLLIAARAESPPPGAASKTSLTFALPHREGALLEALNILHAHRVNMTKLESRPIPGQPWRYDFYLDMEGAADTSKMKEMLAELADVTTGLRVLGSYVSRTVPEGRPVTDEEIDQALQENEEP